MKKSSLLSVMIEGMKLVVSMYEICRTEKRSGSDRVKGNRISRYSESFVAFLVSAYSFIIFIFF